MSNIQTNFFPNSKKTLRDHGKNEKIQNFVDKVIPKNDQSDKVKTELKTLNKDADVMFSDKLHDFKKIKEAVKSAELPDKSNKIEKLRNQINSNEYNIDFDQLANKILEQEY